MVGRRIRTKTELDITKEKYDALLDLAKQLKKNTKTPLHDMLTVLVQIDNSVQVEKLREDIRELIDRYELISQDSEEIAGYN